jgi:hypothetical protein
MSSSSDNDEIVSILALVTTGIATQETAFEMGGSVVGKYRIVKIAIPT